MHHENRLPVLLSLGLLPLVLLTGAAAAALPSGGLRVAKVPAGSAGAYAGLAADDVLLSWSRPAEPEIAGFPLGGDLATPFDLSLVLLEAMPRTTVTLSGTRGGQPHSWELPRGASPDWGSVDTVPELAEPLAGAMEQARAPAADPADPAADGADERTRQLARDPRLPPRLGAWLLARAAGVAARAGRGTAADALYAEALAALGGETDPAAAPLLREWGRAFQRRSDWQEAEARHRRALAVGRSTPYASLDAAASLQALASVTSLRGDYAGAEELYRQTAELLEGLAPGSSDLTDVLTQLSTKTMQRGDLAAAETTFARALAQEEARGLDNVHLADLLGQIASMALSKSELARADRLFERAYAILERLEVADTARTKVLSNWGLVAVERGDFDRAETCFRTALDLDTRHNPESLEVARDLTQLGNVAFERGDLDGGESYATRALALFERLAPQNPFVAGILSVLAKIAAERRDFARAKSFQLRVIESDRRNAPEGLLPVESLTALAGFELAEGDLDAAEKTFESARATVAETAPAGTFAADITMGLALIAGRRGLLAEAQAGFERALELYAKLAPGSAHHAEALHELGNVLVRRGRHRDGTAHLCGALDALDRQRRRLGGSTESQAWFGVPYSRYYHACAGALIAEGRPAEAFQALERGRARSFLDLLAERDLRLGGASPELEARRGTLDQAYDDAQADLAALSVDRDGEAITTALARLADLDRRRDDLAAEIRRTAPRLAALAYPQPLDAAAAARALDRGTALLSYSTGASETYLFAVTPARRIEAHVLPVGERELTERVARFRRLVEDPLSDLETVKAQGRALYDLLLAPAEARLRRSDRLLLSADGPLHTLPFAALVRRDRYLAEWKPLHTVLSATVFAEIKGKRGRPARGGVELAAFGDPVYPPAALKPETITDAALAGVVRRGLELTPLPGSRREVEALSALFPGAKTYVGEAATEERVKQVGREARILHLAAHGLLDERRPLSSALAFTLPSPPRPGQDNGLLQVWEIFEELELDADLVTLSACGTALGQEVRGEGLLGLSRAFQYAGARSVLASLWDVDDDSTSDLMQRFYRSLRRGRSKDEALQRAQADLLRAPATAHPFHWAAFQLSGDWR